MAKPNKSKKSPSRKRYEEEHPTISFRLDRETRKNLKQHLDGSGCSFADFVEDSLGREKSMIEKRVNTHTSRQVIPTDEDRIRCLEDLVQQIYLLTVDTDEYPPYCPRCDNQNLLDVLNPVVVSILINRKFELDADRRNTNRAETRLRITSEGVS